jgi:hypothetical protein
MGRLGIPVFGSIPGSAKRGGGKMSRMKKSIKKGCPDRQPKTKRTLVRYCNSPMLSNLFYKPRFIYPDKVVRKFRRKGKYYYANAGT